MLLCGAVSKYVYIASSSFKMVSRPTSRLNGKQHLEEDIDSRTTKTRVMGLGPCNHYFDAVDYKVPCPCKKSVFIIQLNTVTHGDERCQKCSHPLSVHEDITTASSSDQDSSEGRDKLSTLRRNNN